MVAASVVLDLVVAAVEKSCSVADETSFVDRMKSFAVAAWD